MKVFGFNRWQKGENMRTRKKLIIVSLFITMLLSGCQNKMAGSKGEDKVSDKEQVFETNKKENEHTEDKKNEVQSHQKETETLDESLLRYREEREKSNEKMPDGTVMVVEPNEDDYDIDFSGYEYMSSLFDTREKTEAFEAALKYLKDTYGIEKVYWCIDPRVYELYGNEEKGVADGYEDDNIFVAEYAGVDGEWKYLILVREGKGSEWKVVGDGKDYKE